jgi:hypothetical protein
MLTMLNYEIVDDAGMLICLKRGNQPRLWCGYDDGHAIFAVDDAGTVAGCFCFDVHRRLLHARGTWVRLDWRRHGLAQTLWSLALAEFYIRRVQVLTVTDGGYTLVTKLAQRYPSIDWRVEQQKTPRLLRVLKAA